MSRQRRTDFAHGYYDQMKTLQQGGTSSPLPKPQRTKVLLDRAPGYKQLDLDGWSWYIIVFLSHTWPPGRASMGWEVPVTRHSWKDDLWQYCCATESRCRIKIQLIAWVNWNCRAYRQPAVSRKDTSLGDPFVLHDSPRKCHWYFLFLLWNVYMPCSICETWVLIIENRSSLSSSYGEGIGQCD